MCWVFSENLSTKSWPFRTWIKIEQHQLIVIISNQNHFFIRLLPCFDEYGQLLLTWTSLLLSQRNATFPSLLRISELYWNITIQKGKSSTYYWGIATGTTKEKATILPKWIMSSIRVEIEALYNQWTVLH